MQHIHTPLNQTLSANSSANCCRKCYFLFQPLTILGWWFKHCLNIAKLVDESVSDSQHHLCVCKRLQDWNHHPKRPGFLVFPNKGPLRGWWNQPSKTIFIREICDSPPEFWDIHHNPPKTKTDPCLKQAIIFHCQCARALPGHEVNITFQLLWLVSCLIQLYTNPRSRCQHLKNMVSPFWIILKPDLKNEFPLIRTNKYGKTGISG